MSKSLGPNVSLHTVSPTIAIFPLQHKPAASLTICPNHPLLTVWLIQCLKGPMSHSPTISLSHCPTASLCPSVPLLHCLIVPLSFTLLLTAHCLTAHCLTHPQPHSVPSHGRNTVSLSLVLFLIGVLAKQNEVVTKWNEIKFNKVNFCFLAFRETRKECQIFHFSTITKMRES